MHQVKENVENSVQTKKDLVQVCREVWKVSKVCRGRKIFKEALVLVKTIEEKKFASNGCF